MNNNDILNDPSAVIINKIEVEKFDGSKKLDIKALLVSLNLNSSMTFPSVFAYMLIGDTNNILDNEDFSFVGEEFVTVYIKQPALSETLPSKELTYKFVVNKIDTEIPSEDTGGSLFKLELISVDAFINAGAMKSRGYSNTSTNIVKTILENELKTEIPLVHFEDTVGTTQYAFVESKPFEKIVMVTAQAYNNREYVTSTFSFYENFEGYNFESFENMIQRGIETPPRKLTYKMTVSNDREGYNSIIAYSNPLRFHTSLKMSHGYYSTRVISYNLFEKRAEEEAIILPEKLKEATNRLNNVDVRNSDTFIDKIKELGSLTYLIPYAPPQAYNNPERIDNANKAFLYSSPFAALMRENTIMFKSYGALDLDVGKAVELEFPDTLSTANDNKSSDKDLSGKYIITDISHDISLSGRSKFEFYTNYVCVKESSLRRATFYNKQVTTDNINIKALQ
jgi:hypothetical protein